MNKIETRPQIGIDAFFVVVCFALAPVQGGLDLGVGTSLNKYICFIAMIVVLICRLASRQPSQSQDAVNYLFPFALVCLISVIWASDKSVAVTTLVSYVSYFLFFIILCSRQWNYREKNLFRIIIILADSYYAFLLIKEMISGSLRASVSLTSTGTLADQNVLSVNLVFGFIFALDYFTCSKKAFFRFVSLGLGISMLIGIICTGSRGAFIALIVSTAYYLIKSNKMSKRAGRNVIIAGVVLVFAYLLLMNSEKSFLNQFVISRYTDYSTIERGSGRLDIWQKYFTGLIKHPEYILLGTGLGCTGDVLRSYLGNVYIQSTHNDLLFVLCTYGVFGLFFFVKLYLSIWKKAKESNDILSLTCLVGLMIGCMDVNLISTNGFWNVLILSYMCVGVNNDEQQTNL